MDAAPCRAGAAWAGGGPGGGTAAGRGLPVRRVPRPVLVRLVDEHLDDGVGAGALPRAPRLGRQSGGHTGTSKEASQLSS